MPSGGFAGITGLCKYSLNHKQKLYFEVRLSRTHSLPFLTPMQCPIVLVFLNIYIPPSDRLSYSAHFTAHP